MASPVERDTQVPLSFGQTPVEPERTIATSPES